MICIPGCSRISSFSVHNPVESIALPANGVVRESDGTMTAWVTTDRHHFVQRIIKTGLREDDQVQILAGLQRGELAVTDGAVFLDNMLEAPPSDKGRAVRGVSRLNAPKMIHLPAPI